MDPQGLFHILNIWILKIKTIVLYTEKCWLQRSGILLTHLLIFRAIYLVSNFIFHLQICSLLALDSYSNFYTRPGGVICINMDINMLFRDGGFYIYYHCAQYLYLIQSLDKARMPLALPLRKNFYTQGKNAFTITPPSNFLRINESLCFIDALRSNYPTSRK